MTEDLQHLDHGADHLLDSRVQLSRRETPTVPASKDFDRTRMAATIYGATEVSTPYW